MSHLLLCQYYKRILFVHTQSYIHAGPLDTHSKGLGNSNYYFPLWKSAQKSKLDMF